MPADVTLRGLGLEIWHDVSETQDAIRARLGICSTLTSAGFTLGTAGRTARSAGGPHSLAYASAPLGTLQPMIPRSVFALALHFCLDGKMHVGWSGTLILEQTPKRGSEGEGALHLLQGYAHILVQRRPPKADLVKR